jgi:hypothetical protein
LARVIEDDELSTFEQTTIRYAKWGFGAGILTLVVAVITGWIFFDQLKEMASQTDALAIGAKQSRIDAKNAAIATSRQLDIAEKQARAAQDGVKAIQRQMRQDQRAWLDMQILKRPEFKVGEPVQALIGVTNIGKTAAKNLRIQTVIEYLPIDQAPSLSFKKGVYRYQITTGVLFPSDPPAKLPAYWYEKAPVKTKFAAAVLSEGEAGDLAAGRTYIVMYGKAEYIDIFNVRHITRMCGWLAPARENVFVNATKCTAYNSVDND